ncbi:MAG: exodeoxyribonuclease III [Actinomycetes bacterium]
MRLATWNVNSVRARLPRLLDWLGTVGPDVVCLQETKCASDAFPSAAVEELGYEVAAYGTGQWNGVAVLSRVGLADVVRGFPGEPGFPGPEARAIAATCAGLRVWSLYVPNGRSVDDPHFLYKLAWLEAYAAAVAGPVGRGEPTVACGDLNVAPTDEDVWDPAVFAGATHVTPAERQALARLRDLGLVDVVPHGQGERRPYTFWDYRGGAFRQDFGMRIDLVYATPGVGAGVRDAYVDREARRGTGASDHAPVVVDLDDLPGVHGEDRRVQARRSPG